MSEAEDLFKKALELNPTDSYAKSMLLTLGKASGVQKTSQLKTIMSQDQQPASQAVAYGLLGAEHANNQRWNEAQQAYFNALAADPGNPDFAYNLAVSLERIRQPKLAADYYRKAAELAKTRAPGFDINLVNKRSAVLAGQ